MKNPEDLINTTYTATNLLKIFTLVNKCLKKLWKKIIQEVEAVLSAEGDKNIADGVWAA